MKSLVGQQVICCLSFHAPQCDLTDAVKYLFYDQLSAVTASVFLIPYCGWNGHLGLGYKNYIEAVGMASQPLTLMVGGS